MWLITGAGTPAIGLRDESGSWGPEEEGDGRGIRVFSSSGPDVVVGEGGGVKKRCERRCG